MLYAGSRNSLVQECELTKNFEVRDIDELTQDYIDSKVCWSVFCKYYQSVILFYI